MDNDLGLIDSSLIDHAADAGLLDDRPHAGAIGTTHRWVLPGESVDLPADSHEYRHAAWRLASVSHPAKLSATHSQTCQRDHSERVAKFILGAVAAF